MNKNPFYWVEIMLQPIAKDSSVRYKPFKLKGYIICKKKDLEESIAHLAKTTIETITDDKLQRIDWSILKQQCKHVDFVFDPAKRKEIDEQAKASRGEKPKLSAPPASKTFPI